jgi:hypothetical protein
MRGIGQRNSLWREIHKRSVDPMVKIWWPLPYSIASQPQHSFRHAPVRRPMPGASATLEFPSPDVPPRLQQLMIVAVTKGLQQVRQNRESMSAYWRAVILAAIPSPVGLGKCDAWGREKETPGLLPFCIFGILLPPRNPARRERFPLSVRFFECSLARISKNGLDSRQYGRKTRSGV